MRVTIEPLSPRAKLICEEHGTDFDVIAVDKYTILIRSLDGDWQGVFHEEEASWPDRILDYGDTDAGE